MLWKLKKLCNRGELLSGNFGLEREGLRVTNSGEIAQTPHPVVFEPKIKHPYVTTDFAESQIEFVTPTFSSLDDVHTFLTQWYDLLMDELKDELLWPQSMPANVPSEEMIQTAKYSEDEAGQAAEEYRKHLIQKYGVHRQIISGIHYNFSFKEEMVKKLYEDSLKDESYQTFKDQLYLKVVRNYTRYRWLLVYLLGNSPALHESYADECVQRANQIAKESYSSLTHVSYRNSLCGYQNKEEITVNYDSVAQYVNSLTNQIEKGILHNPKEYYSPIRLKSKNPKDILNSLQKDGVSYLEVRSIDLNPYEMTGIALRDLYFIHLFMLYCLIEEENDYDFWQIEADENAKMVACHGLDDHLNLLIEGMPISLKTWANNILINMQQINAELQLNQSEVLQEKLAIVNGKQILPAKKVLKNIQELGFIPFHVKQATTFKNESLKRRFGLYGYEDLELSTQILIRESLKRGIKVQMLDRQENFIALKKHNHIEYIKQATKTSLDQYSTVLLMENKLVTKLVLESHGINVPRGGMYESLSTAQANIKKYLNHPIVVKPKSTNFGLGISIFPNGAGEEDLNKAIEIAFSNDTTILIEEFIKGKEYRFLVIEDEVVGILHRVPANVCGDGIHSIKELVAIKNQSPLRGKGYKKPLEKIIIDESAMMFLKAQGYTPDSVLEAGKIVYLRENSNISTGGDSLDFTDEIPQYYKDVAVAASKAVGAVICGVDMMIENLNAPDYKHAIIELNFNPAIHIHCFPYKGKQRNIPKKILKALGFI
ncbi:MAG TPA: bifunctional glutamate--cysteine ligase GshA/glutathione synthetase GshB [Firmicutes bacterium]|nr:bifunctional glutamate--cysteine ligase GshA/glutathione synthetase GshB [Bacillota bacterium]